MDMRSTVQASGCPGEEEGARLQVRAAARRRAGAGGAQVHWQDRRGLLGQQGEYTQVSSDSHPIPIYFQTKCVLSILHNP